jgi:hypothetical protein
MGERLENKRVMYTLKGQKGWEIVISDLIFLNGQPHLVLDWAGPPDMKHPHVSVALDPARLSEAPGSGADFLYDGVIEDPRKPS